MKTTAAVIDFGTSKIVTAIADTGTFSRFDIRGTGTVPYAGYQDGEWIEPIELKNRIKDSITAAEYEAHVNIKEIFVSVPADRLHVKLADAEIDVSSEDGKLSEQDMDLVEDACADLLEKTSQVIIHRSPAWFSVDGGKKTMTPLKNMNLKRAGMIRGLTSFITVDAAYVKEMRELFASLNIEVRGFVSSAMSDALMYIDPTERDKTQAFVDVGYLNTEFSVVEGDALVFHKVLPVGGGLITADIAENLGLSMESAEKIKREFSFSYDDLADKLPQYDAFEDGLRYSFDYVTVANAMDQTCVELIDGLSQAIEEAGTALASKAVIYLTGGGIAGMKGASNWLAEQLDYEVKTVRGQSSKLSGYGFTSVLSELDSVFGAIEQKTQTEQSLPGRLVSGMKSFLRKDHGPAETEEPSGSDEAGEDKN